jgi:hypothetical protein
MAPGPAPKEISEPFPISRVAGKYLLFDVDVVAHCRRNHNICGVLVGTIPNLSQQNVFLGLPLELMPEEARVLVENGNAYIVDDAETHRQGFGEMSRDERMKYLQEMDRQGIAAGKDTLDKQEKRKDKALKQKGLRKETLDSKPAASVDSTPAADVKETLAQSAAEASDIGFIMKGSAFTSSVPSVQDATPVSSAVEEPIVVVAPVAEEPVVAASAPQETIPVAPVLAQSAGSGLGFIMKGSSFSDAAPSDAAPSDSATPVAESIPMSVEPTPIPVVVESSAPTGSGLGFLMKGSAFSDAALAAPQSAPVAVEISEPVVEDISAVAEAIPVAAEITPAVAETISIVEATLEALETVSSNDAGLAPTEEPSSAPTPTTEEPAAPTPAAADPPEEDISLFGAPPATTSTPKAKPTPSAPRQYITPTTSHPPLSTPPPSSAAPLPVVPKSYPLFRYLHSRGFFHMPGMRFGCNYSVYPGDPLRYHSHFLATGLGWDEKFALLDVVGGGRLGTGTKKAYMIGGEEPAAMQGAEKDSVRAFSVEWASM